MNRINRILLSYGFPIVLLILVVTMSLVTERFLSFSNIIGVFHSAVPVLVLSCGIVFVIMMGKLDLSVGSLAFLSTAIGSILIVRYSISQVIALPIILVIGILAGFFNGLVVVKLKINSIIATMGTMFIFRGIALQAMRSRVISLPEGLRNFGNYQIFSVYIDIIICLVILIAMYLLHQWTGFGRKVIALGNSEETAVKVGIKADKITIYAFVLSGFFAALAGFFLISQLGAVSLKMGVGWEFAAIGAIVIGGISLFGGEGSILPGLLLGGITLVLFENALNHLGASPYLYPFIRGGLIFIAMYADSLKRKLKPELSQKTV